jgi:hypothetical protein
VVAHRFLQHFDRWKNYFSQILNASAMLHTDELLVHVHSSSEVETANAKYCKDINLKVVIKFQQK